MLHRMQKLTGMTIGATDGEIGKIKDVYFDDHHWTVRYLVVDAGGWLENRKVLISPFAVLGVDWDGGCVRVRLNREQVKGSPHIDNDKPVSRQHEMDVLRYYGYPEYWGGPLLWGATAYPFFDPAAEVPMAYALPAEGDSVPGDPHLQSAAEVKGYAIQAGDEAIGQVEDFLMEDESWAVRYLVVDTRKWLQGDHLVIPPAWARRVDWAEHLVQVGVSPEELKAAPHYDAANLSRDYEQRLHQHYRRSGYWEGRDTPLR